jgi:C4-type Zn-finger protein
MTELRIIPCEACGGDGYFAEPVSHDPFSGRIKEHLIVCTACAGYGSDEAEVEPVELEDAWKASRQPETTKR